MRAIPVLTLPSSGSSDTWAGVLGQLLGQLMLQRDGGKGPSGDRNLFPKDAHIPVLSDLYKLPLEKLGFFPFYRRDNQGLETSSDSLRSCRASEDESQIRTWICLT